MSTTNQLKSKNLLSLQYSTIALKFSQHVHPITGRKQVWQSVIYTLLPKSIYIFFFVQANFQCPLHILHSQYIKSNVAISCASYTGIVVYQNLFNCNCGILNLLKRQKYCYYKQHSFILHNVFFSPPAKSSKRRCWG